ncbi:MAG: LLM class F420-dependent oxidoreductase [Actinomycetia bacterium]|nr:LLM class F420-dependent oxidoreductase [Actinomycetes bacterium]MCP4961528.1 LLM class F420-dependent oxidoreductase [Actinomycetes bacterium]
MRVSVSVGSAYYDGENWEDLVEYVKAADRLGVDSVWSAEAWGMEAVSSLGYLAAVTDQIRLGSGIMQISARTPAMTAMTALSMSQISNDRFLLGLGVSGPQVVEGLHGEAFAKPLGRLREYMQIVRMGIDGERLVYDGEHYVLPRPGGEGKALKSSIRPRPELPIYLATLGPKSLELTGELADGWLGTSFIPEHANVFLDSLATGAARAGRSLDDIDIHVNGQLVVSDDVDALIARARPGMAFTLGGMGSAKTNFYNRAFSRAGYEDVAAEVQRLWVAGDKAAAAAAVPEEMVLAAYPIGTEDMVRDRIRAYTAAGVNCLRVAPQGKTAADQIAHLEMSIDLIKSSTRS